MGEVPGGKPDWLGELVHQGLDANAVIDATGRIVYANDQLARDLGYETSDLIGTDSLELVHAEDLGRAVANLDGVAKGAGPRPGLLRVRHSNGEWISREVKPRAVTLPGLDGAVAIVVRDTSLDDAHWSFLAALAAGDPFHTCVSVLADGLSNEIDGCLAISYDNHDGTRKVAGKVPAQLNGVTADGRYDDTPGTPWFNAVRDGGPAWLAAVDLPEPFRGAALAAGFGAGVAVPVPDAGRDLPAMMVQWPDDATMGGILCESLRRRPYEALAVALDRREVNRRL